MHCAFETWKQRIKKQTHTHLIKLLPINSDFYFCHSEPQVKNLIVQYTIQLAYYLWLKLSFSLLCELKRHKSNFPT